jgi:hypothetical protein
MTAIRPVVRIFATETPHQPARSVLRIYPARESELLSNTKTNSVNKGLSNWQASSAIEAILILADHATLADHVRPSRRRCFHMATAESDEPKLTPRDRDFGFPLRIDIRATGASATRTTFPTYLVVLLGSTTRNGRRVSGASQRQALTAADAMLDASDRRGSKRARHDSRMAILSQNITVKNQTLPSYSLSLPVVEGAKHRCVANEPMNGRSQRIRNATFSRSRVATLELTR